MFICQLCRFFEPLVHQTRKFGQDYPNYLGVKLILSSNRKPAFSFFIFIENAILWTIILLYFVTSLMGSYWHFRYNMLRKKFPATSFTGSPVLSESGLDFLNKLLTYDPEKVYVVHVMKFNWFYLT